MAGGAESFGETQEGEKVKMGEVLYEFDAFEAGQLLADSVIPPELERAFIEGRWTFSTGAVKCETATGTRYAYPGDYVAIMSGRLSVMTAEQAKSYRRIERV